MKWKSFATGSRKIFAWALLLCSMPTFAVLGGSEASVQTDQVQLKASVRTMQGVNYTVHELHSATGTIVREYAAGGTVFGVAWEGAWPPDMQQLLGSYFDQYMQTREQQVRNNPPGRRPVSVQLPGLVVNIAGHPGFFRGQAFVPSMMPGGMTAKDIR